MGIDDLLNGEELIIKQCSVIKELPSKGLKDFSPNNSWIEKKQIENKLEEKFNFINTERIEKSNNISVAEWVPHLSKARVIKKNGKSWETIGHHQDNEDWLMPEEILFLVENCELQLFLDKVPVSVEDCYALLLVEELCTLDEYRVYSYLSRAGLRVVRHSPSVTVTSYEKQVHLDSILQTHRRSPPRTTELPQDDCEVTIIEDDISTVSESVANVSKEVLNHTKENAPVIEVIEIDDDGDTNKVIEEVIDSSDDSSDIVCISSPSYVFTDRSRSWYPTIQKCLLQTIEKIIDLCGDEETPNDFKSLIQNNLELIKSSKARILSLLPNAEKGVSVIYCPDSRLLPNNVVPRYSEYRVNLNVKSDYYAQNHFNNEYSLMPRMPLTNMINRAQMCPELMNNPLLKQAEEMKAMALNMIQTATSLMSALGTQNPNELWNFVNERNNAPFRPRFNAVQQQRPFFRFPRRYTRKRGPRRYFRRPIGRVAYGDDSVNVRSLLDVKPDIVVLSDDEGIDANGKRKTNELPDENLNKKQKLENDLDSTVILEDSSGSVETKPNLDIKTKSEDSGSLESVENSHVKEENNTSSHDKEVDVQLLSQDEVVSSCKEASTSLNISDEPEVVKLKTEDKTVIENSCKQDEGHCCSNTPSKPTAQDDCDNVDDDQHGNEDESLDMEVDNVSASCENERTDNVLPSEKVVIRDEQSSSGLETIVEKPEGEKVTCWKEYKNREDPQVDDEERESLEDSDTLIKFDECSTYENILTSLQIFNDVTTPKEKKNFKVLYDVYLPETNFKKSLKILPNFRVILAKSCEKLPSVMDLKSLKTEYQDQIPFLFSVAFNETVGFYFYDNISLPTLYE